MQVIFQSTDSATGATRTIDHFLIARDADGNILRFRDALPETWEIITDESELRYFRTQFDNRDRLVIEESA
jgi:hypothetical protein